MDPTARLLLFFAVLEEARPFVRAWAMVNGGQVRRIPGPGLAAWALGDIQVNVTGMGRRNAARVGTAVLDAQRSATQLITAGFAGGLNPALRGGDVLFEADPGFLTDGLIRSGARPCRFYEATQVAVTAAEKARLRQESGADAVEMESGTLRTLARQRGVSAATVRVISDSAEETLPLDFNALMTPDDRLDFARLAWTLMRSPGTIPRLLAFQRKVSRAAKALAIVLVGSQ